MRDTTDRHGPQLTPEPEFPADDAAERHPALDYAPLDDQQRGGFDKVVFGVTAAIVLAFLAWGAADTEGLATWSSGALGWIIEHTGWLFILVSSGFVVFVLWLAIGKYGNIPLGRDDEAPEFRTTSWVAMMFSAGMGIGLMFWGAAEPLEYVRNVIPGTDADHAVETAMAQTLFHWTLHPWAIYCVVGLAVAYGLYRKGRVQLISAVFRPLLGKAVDGPVGKVIDMLAIFATLFGSAASLGLGALQIAEGYRIVSGGNQVTNTFLVLLIVGLTIAFIVSAVSGVARGIQWLSNINMVLALLLALFVFLVGPTIFVLNMVPTALGSYVDQMGVMAGRTGAEGPEVAGWLGSWTVFYWAWWVSWTPFVGMFIARISRGRTIRQFVTGVLLVPSVVSLLWFAIFGGAAIFETQNGVDLGDNSTQVLFRLLDQYPVAEVTSVLVMVLVGIFFVSGADAASIVMGSLSERGAVEPKRLNVVFWGSLTGAVAAVMLVIGNNSGQGGDAALQGLQNVTIVAALPFVVVMIGICVSLVRDLSRDPMVVRRAYAISRVEEAVVQGLTDHGDEFALAVVHDEAGTNPVTLPDLTVPDPDEASVVADGRVGEQIEVAAGVPDSDTDAAEELPRV
ncbi:BCCT family transporter [Nocardioides jishulii]|uniref:BCCT family transporter n=1 Tax=Nocardioides jishulii TaxID=2575440 RepID=A0A4U2YQY2_9ACTN|nr:BCCT family transporter [Nocardioides jishulii]QCX26378.1 BCCT family transporter [Nocardioides jishulii]TKI63817.1 BCCT family transporter [Nocardioides jishulii]